MSDDVPTMFDDVPTMFCADLVIPFLAKPRHVFSDDAYVAGKTNLFLVIIYFRLKFRLNNWTTCETNIVPNMTTASNWINNCTPWKGMYNQCFVVILAVKDIASSAQKTLKKELYTNVLMSYLLQSSVSRNDNRSIFSKF